MRKMPRNAYTFCIACAIMISCGMKRSVRKNKRQQQAAGCSMDKKHGTATKHTKSPLSGMNGKKFAAIAAAKNMKISIRHDISFCACDSCSACGSGYICAETPVLLSAANEAHIQPRDLSVISRVLGAASSIFPFSVAEVLIISVGALLTVTLVVRLFKLVFSKLLKRKHNRMRFTLPDFARNVCGRDAESFYALWGINHYRMPAASLLGLSDELERVNSAKSEFIAAAETGDNRASSDIYTEMLASTCEKIAAAAAENRSRLRGGRKRCVYRGRQKLREFGFIRSIQKRSNGIFRARQSKRIVRQIPSFPQNRCIFQTCSRALYFRNLYSVTPPEAK